MVKLLILLLSISFIILVTEFSKKDFLFHVGITIVIFTINTGR